jgi:hypothetical protein
MIDSHTDRVTSLRDRVPRTVVILQVLGSAIAIGMLALCLALLGRGLATSLVAAGVGILILSEVRNWSQREPLAASCC